MLQAFTISLNLLAVGATWKAVHDAAERLYEDLLILRCQAGDEAAVAELSARYSPGLRSYLGRLTGREDSADDLLQETWIDVYPA